MATLPQKIAAKWLRKQAKSGAFWAWVAKKHPQLPNPNPDGREKSITPATLRGYAEGPANTPQERQRQQGAAQMVQRLEAEYQKATGEGAQQEKPAPKLEDIQKVVKEQGRVKVNELSKSLGVTDEKILELALPDLMSGKIHLEPGPTFVDWSEKEDRGKAEPIPEIKKAFVQIYIRRLLS